MHKTLVWTCLVVVSGCGSSVHPPSWILGRWWNGSNYPGSTYDQWEFTSGNAVYQQVSSSYTTTNDYSDLPGVSESSSGDEYTLRYEGAGISRVDTFKPSGTNQIYWKYSTSGVNIGSQASTLSKH